MTQLLNPSSVLLEDFTSGTPVPQKSISGAGLVNLQADYRGDYPENRLLNLSYTLADTANNDTTDLTGYCWGMVNISGLTAGDTVSIVELIDGTTTAGNLAVQDAAGTRSSATGLTNGKFYFALVAKKLQFAKVADGGADAVVSVAFKSVGNPL